MSRYAIVKRYFIPAYINLKSIAFKKVTACRTQLLQERGFLPTSRMLIKKLSRPSVPLKIYIPIERFSRNVPTQLKGKVPIKRQVPLAKYPGFHGFIASNDIQVLYTEPDTPGAKTKKPPGVVRQVGRLDALSESGYFQRINTAKINKVRKQLKMKLKETPTQEKPPPEKLKEDKKADK